MDRATVGAKPAVVQTPARAQRSCLSPGRSTWRVAAIRRLPQCVHADGGQPAGKQVRVINILCGIDDSSYSRVLINVVDAPRRGVWTAHGGCANGNNSSRDGNPFGVDYG